MKQKITCRICHKDSGSPSTFIRHINSKHSDITPEQYCNVFNIHLIPQCLYCECKPRFISFLEGYKLVCVNKLCQNKYKAEKTKEALVTLYGVTNPSQIEGNTEKVKKTKFERYGDENYCNVAQIKNTFFDKYGVTSYTQTDEYKEKVKITSLEKYGTEHYTQSDIVKDKIKETNLERCGYECNLSNPETIKKIKKTSDEKYGGMGFSSKIINEKIKNTTLEIYGCEYATQNANVRKKTEQTNLERYGTKCTLNNEQIMMKLYGVSRTSFCKEIVEKQKENRKKSLNDKYNVDNVSQLQWVQDKIKETNIERYGVSNPMQSLEFIEKNCPNINNKSFPLKTYLTKFGNNITYQSKLEMVFIKDCENNDIEIFDGDCVPYIFENKRLNYYVDFKIKVNDTFQLIEIKGNHRWWKQDVKSGKAEAKIRAAKDYSEERGYIDFKIILDI